MNIFFAQLLNADKLPKTSDQSLKTVLIITYTIIGSIGILLLVISGVRYIFARGDPQTISNAKNSIQHIIIGIVIAVLAASFVGVVVNRLQ